MSERWPTLLPPAQAQGLLRVSPEDFKVLEIPAYLPSGQGEHLFLEVEKVDLTTDQVVRELARQLEIPRSKIGSAGLKDRRAVTRQWISVPARATSGLDNVCLPGLTILSHKRHGNKLKTGHLRGNLFQLKVRGVAAEHGEDITHRCSRLVEMGVPNYFGPQRFGHQGRNEKDGRDLLKGRAKRKDKRLLRLLLSAAQSALFNDLLAVRINEQLFSKVLAGDVLFKNDSGGRFHCEDPATDQARADRLEVHPSGPMFGPKMMDAKGRPGELEAKVLEDSGLAPDDFKRFAKLTRGTRRPLRLAVPSLSHCFQDDCLMLEFQLPPGSYATSLIRELVQTEEAAS